MNWNKLLRAFMSGLRTSLRPGKRNLGEGISATKYGSPPQKKHGRGKGVTQRPEGNRTYEFSHQQPLPNFTYDPQPDDDADPGEVVWAWVPYQEDDSIGKDRPVLVVGRHNRQLLAVQLTSKDHNRDRQQENQEGRYWIDIGTGEWDQRRRESEARVDRLLIMRPGDVRRMGARLDEPIFWQVIAEIRAHW